MIKIYNASRRFWESLICLTFLSSEKQFPFWLKQNHQVILRHILNTKISEFRAQIHMNYGLLENKLRTKEYRFLLGNS